MHRKSLEAAEALKNDDSGGSDREDTASKASDNSSMHSPHSRSFSSNPNMNGGNNNNNNNNNHNDRDNREQNNNKISLGNHNSASPSHNVGKEQMKSPYRGSPGPNPHGDLEKSSGHHPPMNLHIQQLPPPPPTSSSSAAAMLNGKSVLSPPPPGLAAHHHLHQHHHHSHPMPLHSHLMHPGLSPVSSTRTTPPPLPLSLSSSNGGGGGGPPEVSPSSHSHLLAHHPNLPGLDPSKPPPPGAFHPESADPEAFRWVNYREPMSMIRWIELQYDGEVEGCVQETNWELFLSIYSSRNNSIACLRAKAQEHQARILNSGLLLQVRSLAGLQSPTTSSSPHSAHSPTGSYSEDKRYQNNDSPITITGPESHSNTASPNVTIFWRANGE